MKKKVKKPIAKRRTARKAKKITRRIIKKKKIVAKKTVKKPLIKNKVVGIVTHYFPHVHAAVLKVKNPLKVGNSIWIKGHTTDFKEVVNTMQIDRVPIKEAKKGQEIGLGVTSRVRRRDVVYLS